MSLYYGFQGAASFTNEDEEVYVSYNGTITFAMTLVFTQAGPCGLFEEVDRYIIKDVNSMNLVDCQTKNMFCSLSGADDDQWWTVDWNMKTIILHQAKHSNRGPYTGHVEGTDPSARSIQKEFSVKGQIHFHSCVCRFCM